MKDYIRIHEDDNVIVALNEIKKDEVVVAGNLSVTALEDIPAGHKMAIAEIAEQGEVIKYGCRIGNAKEVIKAGTWVHTHNVKTALGDLLDYTYEPVETKLAPTEDVTFMCFNRPDGKVGVRN